jgi:PKD repeat protein
LEVAFTDETTGDVTSWDWNFGDGQTDTVQNPTHTYLAAGDFDVRLIATGPGGADTLTVTGYISVTEGVTADFSVSATTGVAPLAVDFTDLSTGSPTSWLWDFGDESSDTVQNPGHTYTTAGTYSVMLIATGECGPDTLVQTDLIVVNTPAAPVAAFTGTPLNGCSPLEVAFTDESLGDILTWAWDFGDGQIETLQNPTHTFVAAGLFTVSLTVTGPGGSDTKVMEDYVDVEEPVTAAFALSDNEGLAPLAIDFTDQSSGAPTFWRWDFGDATTDTVQNPSHSYTTVDTFTVTLITGNSCSRDTLVMIDAVRVPAISGVSEVTPSRYSLEQNVPNPFNPMTTIYFELPEAANVRLQVFDISGRLVRNLLNGASLSAGRQDVVWNGKDDSGQQVAAGVYFYHMSTGSFSETKRMVLVK